MDDHTGARAHKDFEERNIILGSESLLRALCRQHGRILAVHERAGRFVRWLA